jgi:hypothetical protein
MLAGLSRTCIDERERDIKELHADNDNKTRNKQNDAWTVQRQQTEKEMITTTPGIPTWSPTVVLARPDDA